eukprot:CAMPEP_0170493966 /NCGR_PEP_ID=MMETSP0208-20121228/14366_1 /TAXON_ID=197538 /ORGANISM="Strombidium inclinatum, Strain S3" /LENGTH=141 /DNA_ID=CAMNT_0010769951 /DNA_START=1750 /DNA_END=2172 /DNA_ORIENTATION=-
MSLFKHQVKGLQVQTRNWLFGSREISSGGQNHEEDDISETYSSGSSLDSSPLKTAVATGGTKMSADNMGSMSDQVDSGMGPTEEAKCESLEEYQFKYTTPPVISSGKKLGGESTPQFHQMAMVEEDSSGQEDMESKIIELW